MKDFGQIPNIPNMQLEKIDISRVMDSIREYDDKFNIGSIVGRSLSAGFNGENIDFDQERKGMYQKVMSEHSGDMNVIGLAFEQVKNGPQAISEEVNIQQEELRLNLVDGKKYIQYLKTLNPEVITESQARGLVGVVGILNKQLMQNYDLSDSEDDRLIELMGSISEIINEYSRLGKEIGESVSDLSKYLEYARKGCLREFRDLQKLSLDKPFTGEGFNLRWHLDASPEFFSQKWTKVVDLLRSAYENEAAREIYNQAVTTAKEAILSAFDECRKGSEDESLEKRRYYGGLLPIATSFKTQLEDF